MIQILLLQISVEDVAAPIETVEAAEAVGTFCGSILYPSKMQAHLAVYLYLTILYEKIR